MWRVLASLFVGLCAIGGFAWWQTHLPTRTVGENNAAAPRHAETVTEVTNEGGLTEPPSIPSAGQDIEVAEAIAAARQVVLQRPESAEAWGVLGMVLYTHDFLEAAIQCFKQAERLDSQEPRWAYLLGHAARSTDAELAVDALRRATELCGNEPPAVRLMYSEVLMEAYRLDEAEQQLKLYQLHRSDDLRLRLDLARLVALRGDARACYEQLLSLQRLFNNNPDYRNRQKQLLLLMAESLRRLRRPDEADQALQRADQQAEATWPDPFYKEVFNRRVGLKVYLNDGDSLFREREYDRSIELLTIAEGKYPDSIWAKILLARSLIRTGAPDSDRPDGPQRLARADDLLQAALQLDENSVEAMFRLAVCKGYQGEYDAAIELYRRAVSVKPDFAMAHFNLAGILWNNKHDRAGAIEAFEATIRAEPSFVDGHFGYGQLLMQMERYADAEKQFDEAVRLQPDSRAIRAALGESRRRQGN
ncbi:MAG: tetratricopeptide repeat protein [Planctomycetales bacterium]|nr:tetratricopeptide repeat protein [Planctomycetales bacterium]